MKRRIIAASVAILVALVSGVLLLSYVNSADQRAMAGMRTETVLVVTSPVPQGTAAEQLDKLVALKELPSKTVVPGALTTTSMLKGKVTTTALQPGEQLLASRFADPSALKDSLAVQLPKGFSEVSVQLDPQRAVGNNLSPGDHVAVFISLGSGDTAKTHLVLDQVLVTRIQGVTASQAEQSTTSESTTDQTSDQQGGQSGSAVQPAPQGSLMITMALSANDAEQVVYAAQYGQIWLSLENEKSRSTGTRIVTEKNDQE